SDDKYIVTGSYDKTVRIWCASTGVQRQPIFSEHESIVYSVAWSRNGRFIASGEGNGAITIWDVKEGQPLASYQAGSGAIRQLAWSPDSQSIVFKAGRTTIQIWQPKTNLPPAIQNGVSVADIVAAWADYPWRARHGDQEMAVGRASTGKPAVWFATPV